MFEEGAMAKILIADDDQQVRVMLKMTLERAGYDVVEAEDGNEAVAKFKAEKPDLVVTDIVMPEKEGIETIMELRALDPAVQIIAISGGGRINPEDYLAWAQKFGVEETFTKPVDRALLLEAVEGLLSRS
jgi:CheY-like chemotaxis protein